MGGKKSHLVWRDSGSKKMRSHLLGLHHARVRFFATNLRVEPQNRCYHGLGKETHFSSFDFKPDRCVFPSRFVEEMDQLLYKKESKNVFQFCSPGPWTALTKSPDKFNQYKRLWISGGSFSSLVLSISSFPGMNVVSPRSSKLSSPLLYKRKISRLVRGVNQ